MRIFKYFIIAAMLLTSACVKQTTIRHSAGYEHIMKERKTIAFLPSYVEVNTVGIGSKERMYDYESNLEGTINREVPPLLRAKGYDVKLYRKSDIKDAELSHQVVSLRDKYNATVKGLYNPLLMKEELAFNTSQNLGDKAKEIGSKTGSDILVLVDYSGSVKTNGARALGVALDVLTIAAGGSSVNNNQDVDSARMMIAMIDAKTGDYLWSNTSGQTKDIYSSAFDNISSQEEVDIKRVKSISSGIFNTLPDKNKLDLPPAK